MNATAVVTEYPGLSLCANTLLPLGHGQDTISRTRMNFVVFCKVRGCGQWAGERGFDAANSQHVHEFLFLLVRQPRHEVVQIDVRGRDRCFPLRLDLAFP